MDMSKKITFVRFCFASAYMLQEDLGLPTEKLICLYKECIEMAKHCNDISTMVYSCIQFVWHSNSIGRHADSLRCLKEILPSAVVRPSAELIVHKYLSLTYNELKEFDNVVLHAKKWIAIARNIGDKENEISGYHVIGNAFISLARYGDALDCGKKCLGIAQESNSAEGEIKAYECIMVVYEYKEKHDDTILYAHKLLDCAMKTNDQRAMMKAYLQLGEAHFALNHYQDATDFGKKFLEKAREIEDRCGEVQAYLLMGKICSGLSDYDNAIIYCKKCIELAITIGDKQAEALAYSILGDIYCFLGKYDDAISNCNKCVHIDKEDNLDKVADVIAYLTLGRVNHSLKKYEEAIQNYKQCIDIVNCIGREKEVAVRACLCLGEIYHTLEQYNDAVHYSKKCIEMAHETGEKMIEAQACFHLSKIYETKEQYNDAVHYSKKCIEMAHETGEKSIEARACLHLGKIYHTLGQYNDAVYYSKKCIEMAQETGEKMIEAQACLHLLTLYVTLDEKDNAIQYGKKCLNLCQETNDKNTQMDGHVLLAQVYLGSMQLNDMYLSIDAGMAIAKELGDKQTEENLKIILSTFYTTVGLPDKVNACDEPSVKEFLEVLTCSEDDLLEDLDQAMKTGNKIKKHKASMRLKIFYLSKKDYGKTVNCLERLKEMDLDPSVNLYCFQEIGRLYHLMDQNDMALRWLKEGLPTTESCSNNMQLSIFYYSIGSVLFSLNRELDCAEDYLMKAIRCFEANFMKLGSRDEFKISIVDHYIHSYKLLAILLINGKKITEALLVLDRCRARALKDLMISNFKMEQERSNDEHLEYSDVLSLVSRNDISISYYSLCFNVFFKFFLEGGTNLHFSIHSNAGNTSDFLQIDVDTMFDEMGVREVVNCEDRCLDKEQDIQEEQKRSKEEYEGLNQPTASLLNLDSKRGESNENSAETKGSTLEVLFGILECDRILSSKQDEVVIIPEGPLYKVPFSALRDPHTGKYLSETKRIRLAPSLATLKHFEDFPTDRTSNAEPLIIGDPLVGKVMMDGEERDIESLPGAREEAAEISVLLNTPALLTKHATKPSVIKRLQEGVSIVHIAAHGILSKATIVLAPSPEIRATRIPDEEDYMLTMAEVQQAKVRAQLVVLSCCHSGRGEIRAEGVVGMCRAFLASGARAVVASLWAIDDDATFEFMQKFYLSLKDGKSASTSLQQAMKEMRNTTSYSKPKYWAPFFLMGDDVTINL